MDVIAMSHPSIGIWLIGAQGVIGTNVSGGLGGLPNKLADQGRLGSAPARLNRFKPAHLSAIHVRRQENRETGYTSEARQLHDKSGVFGEKMLHTLQPAL